MKKKKMLIWGGLILIILVLLLIILTFISREKITVDNKVSGSKYVSIYAFSDGRKVYSEFTDVKYTSKDGKNSDLSDALKSNPSTIDNVMKTTKKQDMLNDGGTRIYYFKDFDIVKCHKTRENDSYIEDYYIVSNARKVIDNLCK